MTSFVSGPSGGSGGTPFTDDIPSKSTVSVLRIRAGALVDSVQLAHVGPDGGGIDSPAHGGLGGEIHTIPLGENVFISKIRGRYGASVDSLVITTRAGEPIEFLGKKVAFPQSKKFRFGGKGGASRFVYSAPPGYEIAGFCGRSDKVVDAIGVVFRPLAERGLETSFVGIEGSSGGGAAGGPGGGGVGGEDPGNLGTKTSQPTAPPPVEPPEEKGPMERSGGPIKPT